MSDPIPSNGLSPREVIVVPHTHWEREWYKSFEETRLHLLELAEQLICLSGL